MWLCQVVDFILTRPHWERKYDNNYYNKNLTNRERAINHPQPQSPRKTHKTLKLDSNWIYNTTWLWTEQRIWSWCKLELWTENNWMNKHYKLPERYFKRNQQQCQVPIVIGNENELNTELKQIKKNAQYEQSTVEEMNVINTESTKMKQTKWRMEKDNNHNGCLLGWKNERARPRRREIWIWKRKRLITE